MVSVLQHALTYHHTQSHLAPSAPAPAAPGRTVPRIRHHCLRTSSSHCLRVYKQQKTFMNRAILAAAHSTSVFRNQAWHEQQSKSACGQHQPTTCAVCNGQQNNICIKRALSIPHLPGSLQNDAECCQVVLLPTTQRPAVLSIATAGDLRHMACTLTASGSRTMHHVMMPFALIVLPRSCPEAAPALP